MRGGSSPRSALTIRRGLRPGDLGSIVAQHGRLYARRHWDAPMLEARVAASLARAVLRGFPSDREAIWIVEEFGEHAGSVALTDEGDGEARLRWIALSPGARARGVGRRLEEEAIARARALGFRRTTIEALDGLISGERGCSLDLARDVQQRWGEDVLSPTASLEALLGAPRSKILRGLDRERTVSELARLIRSVPSAASGHVHRLVASGLAVRERKGRHIVVRRTSRGNALLSLYEPA